MSPKQLRFLIFSCFFLSGATALIYEVAWVRHMSLIFGSTAFTVSTVLTAFMAGLALGSYAFGRWIDRRGSPLITYASLEIIIGLYALAMPFIFQSLVPLYERIWALFHPQYYLFSLIRFALAFVVLTIPATAMGGTLPVLAKYYERSVDHFTSGMTGLYAVNTFGAVLGTVSAGFLLIPTLGLSKTVLSASLINFLVAAVVLASVAVSRSAVRKIGDEPASMSGVSAVSKGTAAFVLFSFAATGFAALALEVVWTRMLTLIIGPSVYAFSIILSTFLVGLALGSFVFSRLIERWRLSGIKTIYSLQLLIGLFTWVTLLLFHQLPFWYATLFHRWGGKQSSTTLFGIEFIIAFLAMFLPTLFMGGVFPAVVKVFEAERGRVGRIIGRIYAANTLGAILGSFCAGFVLIPILGIHKTVLAVIFIYFCLSALTAIFSPSSSPSPQPSPARGEGARRLVRITLPVAVALGVFFFTPAWNQLTLSGGAYRFVNKLDPKKPLRIQINNYINNLETLFYQDGTTATVSVLKEKNFEPRLLGDQIVDSLLLMMNGKIDASSYRDMPTQILSGHLGPLFHPNPQDVMVIGLASGTTAGSLLRHPIRSLKILELETAVVQASHYFDFVNHRPLEDPRAEVIVNDGRNYLLVTPERFDLIVSEPSNPWISGPANLFTQEFFRIAESKLNKNGLFVQWVQTYSMSPQNMRVLIRTFQSVFPHVLVFSGMIPSDLLLVGAREPMDIDLKRIEERLRDPEVRKDLTRMGIEQPQDLYARFRLGGDEVVKMVKGMPLNTDDNALIEFGASKDLYQATSEANMRLLEEFEVR